MVKDKAEEELAKKPERLTPEQEEAEAKKHEEPAPYQDGREEGADLP